MKIGIDASRAFLKNRTGIEEYSYQIIKNLRDNLGDHQASLASTRLDSIESKRASDHLRESRQVVLYVKKTDNLRLTTYDNKFKINDLELPENWQVKIIKWPRFWTQIGLSLEMFFNKVDALLIPAHTVPLIHPKNTVVVVHGLEYEFCPEAYSWWERFYMRFSIKNSCKWASRIISVSQNTKKDLIRLYNVPEEKIEVVYEGYNRQGRNFQFPISNFQSNLNDQIQNSKKNEPFYTKYKIQDTKYFLFIGRIETRKNIVNVIKAFEIFKEKHKTDHKLVLAGRAGYGFENIKYQITNSKFKEDVVELGYIAEEEKWELLKNADAFIFATLYEGFGIPILEAQSVGCPIIASDNSSIPEVVTRQPLLPLGEGACGADEGASVSALLVNPNDTENISEAMVKLATNEEFKKDLIEKGLENIKRFSWSKCGLEISDIIQKQL